MGDIDLMLKELKRYGNAGRDCALSAEDALTIADALEAAREDSISNLRVVAKRNLRSLIELGSDDKRLMLSCLEELS